MSADVTVRALRTDECEAVGDLHRRILPTLNARLHPALLTYLYEAILRDARAAAFCAWRPDTPEPAAFISVTTDFAQTRGFIGENVPLSVKAAAGIRLVCSPANMADWLSHRRLEAYIARHFVDGYPSILTVGVAPSLRGTGLGRTLLSSADEFFRARGVRRYFVDTREDNRDARRFYEKNGFKREAEVAGNVIFSRALERT